VKKRDAGLRLVHVFGPSAGRLSVGQKNIQQNQYVNSGEGGDANMSRIQQFATIL
jgi:hypothetical protein